MWWWNTSRLEKFAGYTRLHDGERVNDGDTMAHSFHYLVEVYVDDFMSFVIPTSEDQLQHVANIVIMGIHDVFPEDGDESNNPISLKKMKNTEGQFSMQKCILGFNFDGRENFGVRK